MKKSTERSSVYMRDIDVVARNPSFSGPFWNFDLMDSWASLILPSSSGARAGASGENLKSSVPSLHST